MKLLYTILFIFVFLLHLFFLGIINILELIGKGFCWINGFIADYGDELSDKSNIDNIIDDIKSWVKKWKNS